MFYGSDNVIVYRLAESTDWPPVPTAWADRPTALWQLDSDNDGIPDFWVQQYFGSPTNANPNAICSNGMNTIREAYIAGLNPTNAQSFFGVTNYMGNELQWSGASGRVYSVYWTTNLLSGFQCLESNIPWNAGSYTDTNSSNAGKCFYKLDVRLEE